MAISGGTLPTPQWLRDTFEMSWIGRGSNGAVLRLRWADQNYAGKVMVDAGTDAVRELLIASVLTEAYTDAAAATVVTAPIVKYYDSGTAQWKRRDVSDFFVPMIPAAEMPGVRRVNLMQLSRATSHPDEMVDVSLMVMEYAGPYTFHDLLGSDYVAQLALWQEVVLAIVCQTMCTLEALGVMFRFNHLDLSTANIILNKGAERDVYRHAVSSDTVYYVRSAYQAKLMDFGSSRLEHQDQTLAPEWTGNTYQSGGAQPNTPQHFVPWADVTALGLAMLASMSPDTWRALPRESPLFDVLLSMLPMSLPAGDKLSNDLLIIRGFILLRKAGEESALNLDPIAHMAAAARLVVYAPLDAGPSPRDVLQANAAAFDRYLNYRPGAEDRVVDQTLHIGDQSPATRAAWRALQSARRRVAMAQKRKDA